MGSGASVQEDLLTDAGVAGEQSPYNGKAQQKDDYPEVVMKMPKNGEVVAKVPNGEILTVLEVDGDGPDSQGRVRWQETEGWVKMCNVSLAEAQPAPSPSPQAAGHLQRMRQRFPYNAIAQQKDNHPEVVMRMPKNGAIVAKVPNGETLIVLEVDGHGPNSQGRMRWKESDGWVKMCNVTPVAERADESDLEAVDQHMTPESTDSVGFWEYADAFTWLPYTRDESRRLDAARQRGTDFSMEVGPDKMSCVMSFQVNEDGVVKQGTQTSLTHGRTRNIRREASARELVQIARSVLEECLQEPPDFGVPKYTKPESILEILGRETQPVKLLRGSWVKKYAGTEGQLKGLPRRQDLEQTVAAEAFLPHAQVESIGRREEPWLLNIISISYCWRCWDHPDADGKQLRDIDSKLKDFTTIKIINAGIFLDFCSLHQKDKNGRRTKKEHEQFSEALDCMDIWYMHTLIMTFIVNPKWARELGLNYEDRGWTHFERSCAELIKPATAGGVQTLPLMITEFEQSGRKLPLSPELFAEYLAQKRFTSRGDKEKVVALYTKACMLALRGTQKLSFEHIKLQRHGGKQLASVLWHCCNVDELLLVNMDMGDDSAVAIAEVLPRMQNSGRWFLSENRIGDDGAKAIAQALPMMQKLETLHLDMNKLGDDGAIAIAQALPMMQKLAKLGLAWNKIGDDGAEAIAKALSGTPSLEELNIRENRIAENGRRALEQAWRFVWGNTLRLKLKE